MIPQSIFQMILLAALLLFSIADLIYRIVPAADFFFISTFLLSVNSGNWGRLIPVVFAVGIGSIVWIPIKSGIFLLFSPPAWPAYWMAYGVRKKLLGRADLYVIGCICILYSLDIALMAWVGMLVWLRCWKKLDPDNRYIPLLPGVLLGVILGLALRSVFKYSFFI